MQESQSGKPDRLIRDYNLLPHPEGGYYKESYRSPIRIPVDGLAQGFTGERSLSTAIYFLLLQGNFSAFHRICSDECWHFYEGDPLWVHIIHPDGHYQTITLGPGKNAWYQWVVPAGCWFASEVAPGGEYAFVGCTVSPGFDFADFELATTDALVDRYPNHTDLIRRLCRA